MAVSALPAADLRGGGARTALPDDPDAFAAALLRRVTADGSAAHALIRGLGAGDEVAHTVAMLHGDHPDAIDIAARSLEGTPPAAWLTDRARGFAIERAWLARRVAAVPALRGPGVGSIESAARAQRDGLATLARSGRAGCALGAAFALLAEWGAIRLSLGGGASDVLGPDAAVTLSRSAVGAAERRAIEFGAAQVTGMHAALWDMLAARRDALP